jgi:DNA segregation ATPase FtsK/SpoIIIE-like protein
MTYELDELVERYYPEAVDVARKNGWARISVLQCCLRIGYLLASKLIDKMAAEGIVEASFSYGEVGHGHKYIGGAS